MKVHAAVMLIATLMLSGTVLAQSSGPSAGGPAGGGQAANVTTTGQALNSAKKTGDSGPPIDKAARQAKPDAGAASNTVGVNRRSKTDRRNEHYP
ncbi:MULTISPECIES: hypothetical protein [unclassified Bradyrhizobium]|uniref:hypothetical protein n=1 Tax=unclassified Bradyrhizobium TaxID=2631580 RepID=UPI00247A8737|nr:MULTISPECIES: hypothetical protein [unclassified Bradyrhizobium]WGR91576.1 hypothetical protein MTX20_24635 [Bradyrhizobium sp. ISRA435]WGS01879.1 hypothetical protein MTX23_14135 [Bradyrhizobium sp. ISRA436]WGS08765.1 hypothetical protein MTX18_14125 [Bradyrhizobium sp. ISRA437]WGS15653.1 hypothetical protein MTX26_14125 [Bradyrhizobium sp. ISRA443]WGS23312.1 hypothetical protein MTX22_17780 [Bradyrhizobium sp. ISRA463]